MKNRSRQYFKSIKNGYIQAVVKFNDGEALVLKEGIKLGYNMFGNATIVGTDGIFIQSYSKSYDSVMKAFGGRKFDIVLENGETVHCSGEWWSGMNQTAMKTFGNGNEKIIHATAASIEELKRCYVFCGYEAIERSYKSMRRQYKGIVYSYYEYDCILNNHLPKYRLSRFDKMHIEKRLVAKRKSRIV